MPGPARIVGTRVALQENGYTDLLALPLDCIYNLLMEIAFDPAKNERNIRERGLPFELAAEFDFESAVAHVEQHGKEDRIVSVGYLGNRLHVLCYLETAFGIRVISFRKANQREARKYGVPKTLDR